MSVQVASPLGYHRSRRDHHLRLFFSAANRSHNGKPLWLRSQGGGRREIMSILDDAFFHAQEVARGRTLEWPGETADEADRAMLGFLEEIRSWFTLLENLAPGGDDPRPGIAPLLENRIRHGLRLFHTGRHVQLIPAHPHF